MSFWDKFVLRLYFALSRPVPAGPAAAARLLELAHGIELLDPSGLDELSVLLVTMLVPDGRDVRRRAQEQFTARRLSSEEAGIRLAGRLHAATPPRSADLLALAHGSDSSRKGAAHNVLLPWYVPSLMQFLGRWHLDDPEQRFGQAVKLLSQAAGRFWHLPPRTMDFLCRLYRHALHPDVSSPTPPDRWPAPRPQWAADLQGRRPEEVLFLDACLAALPADDRQVVYLAFYANLDAGQIACVLQGRERGWTTDRVVSRLEGAWGAVLRRMR
jgi:hypothetical protein